MDELRIRKSGIDNFRGVNPHIVPSLDVRPLILNLIPGSPHKLSISVLVEHVQNTSTEFANILLAELLRVIPTLSTSDAAKGLVGSAPWA